MRTSKAILAATLTLAFTVMLSSVVHAYTVVSGHPRVDIRPSDLPTLAARATGSHSGIYNDLIDWCDSHINDSLSMGSSDLGHQMEAYAFVYLIEKQLGHAGYRDYSDRAKALMAQMPSSFGGYGGAKIALAHAYDWVYPELTSTEKASLIPKMRTITDDMIAYNYGSGTHSVSIACAPLVHMGLALYDDDRSKALEALDRFRWWLIDTDNPYRIMDNWNETAGDGAEFAGDYAYHVALRFPAEMLHAWDKGTEGEDQAANYNHLENSGLFYAYVATPEFPYTPLGDGRLRYTYEETRHGLHVCSTIFNDGRAKWAAGKGSLFWIYPMRWRYILWDDPTLKSTPPNDLSKSRFFDSLGVVYMRSGWDLTGSSTDILSNFRCSKRADWHTQCDQLSFEIRRGTDYLAIDSGFGSCLKGLDPPGEHFADYYIRTVAHNSMLIFNPNEVFDMASFHVRKNDGGQQWSNRDGPWPIGSRLPGGKNARGFIERFHNHSAYTYSYADATSAYSSTGNDQGQNTKVDNVTRQYIYLKDRFFVVFDRVNSLDNPPVTTYEKRWLLHSIDVPQIEDGGSWNGGATPNAYGGTPGTTSSNTNVLSVSRGNSKLFINVLYPSDHVVKKIGGPSSSNTYNNANSYEFYHNGSNNYSSKSTSITDGRWRIEVSPRGSDIKRQNIFLHVLEPVSATTARTPVAQVEDATNGFYGAHIRHSGEPWVVMCSEQEQLKQTVSYTIAASGRVRHLVCDLAPGSGQYNVYRNGQLLPGSPFAVTAANTLYFEADGGGTFTVAEGPPPVITVDAVTTPTAVSQQTITGAKTTSVVTVRVNGSTAGVTITSSTTWSYAAQLTSGNNTFNITGHNSSGTAIGSASAEIYLDSTRPNAPTNLTATGITNRSISLAWTPPAAASDGDTASNYIIKRDGVEVAATALTNHTDSNLNPVTEYSYEVFAVDDVGNVSASGASGVFTTLETPSFESVSINFEEPGSVTPSGFLKDSGLPYNATRGYGWDVDLSSNTRDRDIFPDQKLDTFIFSATDVRTWQYDIPNGEYLISLASGDHWPGTHRIVVEGVTVIDNQSTAADEFITIDRSPATVLDGQLTVAIGGTTESTRLNYIIIEGQGGPPPTDETPPTGNASINAGTERTNSNVVSLTLLAIDSGSGMGTGAQMQFSNDSSSWSTPEPYATSKSWTLVDVASGDEATRTVYVKFKDVAGNWSQPISDSILLDKRPPQTPIGLSFGG